MEMLLEKKETFSQEYLDYLKNLVENLDEIVTLEDGSKIRVPAGSTGITNIIDSLTGIIRGDYDLDEIKGEVLRKKYELTD